MCFIGLATLMGLIVEIPIIVHSLGTCFMSDGNEDQPMPFDMDFIAMLKVGTNDEQVDRVVESYAHDWWNNSHPRWTVYPDDEKLLSTWTLWHCLNYHQEPQCATGDEAETEITSTLQLPDPGATYLHGTTNICGTTHSTSVADPCPHCDIHRTLSGDIYAELVSLKSFTSAMAVSSGNDVEIASCWACGFYTLYETMLLKELPSALLTVKGTSSSPQKTRLG